MDNPQAYLPGDRRRALAAGRQMPPRSTGCVLFADVSGFTPLTEALAAELGPTRGAEELAAVLDAVVGGLLGVLHAYGGSAIYFSGDAVTCWLDGDDGTTGAHCALAMQERMREVGVRQTPGGHEITLTLKVALDVGGVRRFVVGDPTIQLIDVLAGSLMDTVAEAEHHARPGDVVLGAGAARSLAGVARMTAGGHPCLTGMPRDTARRVEPAFPPLPAGVVRPWLLPAVWERMASGRGEMLADLRPATPLFLRFAGFDLDDDPAAPAALDAFVVAAQRVVHLHGGNLLQLTIGDKGASLYAVFGSPVAHGDDSARACTAALDLLALDRTTAARDLQIGIARGRLRSGTYGHRDRRTFCCLGDAVNVAARLMVAAPAGVAYATAAVERGAAGAVRTRRLEPLSVKGKSRPLDVVALVGPGDERTRAEAGSRLPFVGRGSELATLTARADAAASGRGQIVLVEGDPGIGKSRLLAQLVDGLGDRFATATGRARGTGLYTGWRDLVAALLQLDLDDPGLAAALGPALSDLDPALLPRAPLLGPLLGVDLTDSDLTASLDPRLRKASLEEAVARCITVLASRGPTLLLLEDAHRLDALGRDLLRVVRRAVAAAPVLLLVATRRAEGGPPLLPSSRSVTTVRLAELDAASVEHLAASKLGALGASPLSPRLLRLVAERGGGNPFYVEELVSYVHEQGVDPADDAALAALDLPDSLQSLVLSRIDALPGDPRRVIKVASVVGASFGPPVLVGAYPELGPEPAVATDLGVLTAMALTLGPDDEQEHHFRHAVTGEVSYESLPHAFRSELHGRVSRWLEARHADDLDRVLDSLAFHYGRGTDEAKKREFLVRAGVAAQAAYANDAAEDYFARALPLVEGEERVDLLLRLGQLRELRGAWTAAEVGYLEAETLAVAGAGRGRCLVAAADVARKEGHFTLAQERLDAARASFAAAGDGSGLARVLHLEGTLASQQGLYPQARECYDASLVLRRAQGDRAAEGALLSNLALVAECLGDYAGAEDVGGRALQVRLDIRDRPGVAVSHNNLGMLAQLTGRPNDARGHFERSMELAGEVGDRWLVSVGQHNLGNVHRDAGDIDAARVSYRSAYLFYADTDDRWSTALLLEDLAQLATGAGAHRDALLLLGAADRLRGELDAPRAPSLTAELTAALVLSRVALGDESDTVVAAGVAAGEEDVRAEVLSLCAPDPAVGPLRRGDFPGRARQTP